MLEVFYTFLSLILSCIVVITLAYVSTKLIVKAQMGVLKNKNIKVIEGLTIAPQKALQLVEVGDEVFLIGITKDSIIKIDKIEKESLKLRQENLGDLDTNSNSKFSCNPVFANVFNNIIKRENNQEENVQEDTNEQNMECQSNKISHKNNNLSKSDK